MENKTALEELLSIVKELRESDKGIDINGLEDWINSVGLPKDKEQRKSLVIGSYLDVLMKNHGLPMSLEYYNLLEEKTEEAEKLYNKLYKQKIESNG